MNVNIFILSTCFLNKKKHQTVISTAGRPPSLRVLEVCTLSLCSVPDAGIDNRRQECWICSIAFPDRLRFLYAAHSLLFLSGLIQRMTLRRHYYANDDTKALALFVCPDISVPAIRMCAAGINHCTSQY